MTPTTLDPTALRVFNPAFYGDGDHPSLTEEPEHMTDVLALLGSGWTAERVIDEYPHLVVFTVDETSTPPVAEWLAAHDLTCAAASVLVGTCDDCLTAGVEVLALEDFDTRTGDPLPDRLVCGACYPLRCGDPECPTCTTPAGEVARAAAVARQIEAGTLDEVTR